MHFSVKFFLTAKLHIVLVFEEQDAILNFGLAPFFKTILFIEMKKSPYFQTIKPSLMKIRTKDFREDK